MYSALIVVYQSSKVHTITKVALVVETSVSLFKMKTFVLCVFLPFLCSSFFCDAKYIYQELYIDVPLDHFR